MLKEILAQLIKNAKANPNKEQVKKLRKGLYIYMMWTEPFYAMTIAREKTTPSAQEMKTCIGSLPNTIYSPNNADVLETTHNERKALRVIFAEMSYVQPMFE